VNTSLGISVMLKWTGTYLLKIKTMNIKRIALASIVIWIVGSVFAMLTCGWLFNWVYEIPPIIWKPVEEMMATNNMVTSYVLGLIVSIIFVSVYAWLYDKLPGKGAKKGMTYGFIVWLVGALSGTMTMPLYMTIAVTVVVYWIIQALILNLIIGAITGAIYKK